jgi:NADH:ubiquinone oxidoreductase subunit F (NADH-binding)
MQTMSSGLYYIRGEMMEGANILQKSINEAKAKGFLVRIFLEVVMTLKFMFIVGQVHIFAVKRQDY